MILRSSDRQHIQPTTPDPLFATDHLMESLGGRTARGGAITVISHGLRFVISIVATSILARLLTPQDYGLIGMVAVVTNFVGMFKDLGLSLATVQRPEITRSQISTLFWLNMTLSLVTMLVLVAISPAISWFYSEPRLEVIAVISAFGFVIGGFTVQHEALIKRQMRFYALSAISLASIVTGYTVGIILAWNGFGFWALIYSQLALLMTNAFLVWSICRWRPGLPSRNTGIRSMVSFGGHITAYSTINYFAKNADSVLIGKFWASAPLGLYNKAAQLVGLPTEQVTEPLMGVVIPSLSRLAGTPDRYRKAYLRIMEKILILVMPTVGLIIVTSDWLIAIVLGKQWNGAAPILLFMSIAGLFQPLIGTAGWLLVTQGRGRDMLHWSLINAPISILSIVAGLGWGAVGVAASYSVARILIAQPLIYWFVGRRGPVTTKDFYRVLAPFTLATLLGIATCTVFRHFVAAINPILGLLICAPIMFASTILVLSAMRSGRAALMDVKNTILLLTGSRAANTATVA
ncbi:MAG: lipopolysaccharide biosynthesis protein [Pyrinomonadaceae bacterium]